MPFDIDDVKRNLWSPDLLSCNHVDYALREKEWEKIRIAYAGGEEWIERA